MYEVENVDADVDAVDADMLVAGVLVLVLVMTTGGSRMCRRAGYAAVRAWLGVVGW